MQQIKKNKKTDPLSAYYLGGRSFGPLLTAGSLFATLYSGYTISGIPNEAFRTGWMALHWMPMFFTVAIALMGTGYRLRKAGAARNHSSPVDFITDRYQSHVLRYTIVFLQILPTLLYLAVHVIAIQRVVYGILGASTSTIVPTSIIMAFLLGSEMVGGLYGVAITDTIQAFIMVAAFLLIPIALKNNSDELVDDWESYSRPDFYQTPSKDSQWLFWQFSMINVSFLTLPHVMQRVYAARDLKSLKFGYAALSIAPWLIISSVFIGVYAVAVLVNPDGSPMKTYDVYYDVLRVLMDQGGFAQAASCIGVVASLAAILSTANSLIVALSHLVTAEIIQPLSRANSSNEGRLVWYGRAASIVLVLFAMLIGFTWCTKSYDMIAIVFPVATQALPAFLFGLFSSNQRTDVHPWSLSSGAVAGAISVFGIYFGYFKSTYDSLPIDSGIAAVAVNLLVLFVAEVLRRLVGEATALEDDSYYLTKTDVLYPRPSWDIPNVQERFGGKTLTPQYLWKLMEGVKEPLTNWSWTLLMIVSISFVTPFVEENQPALNEDGGFSSSNLPTTVNGIPWWAFKIIVTCILPASILYVSIYQLPDTFPTLAESGSEIEHQVSSMALSEEKDRAMSDTSDEVDEEADTSDEVDEEAANKQLYDVDLSEP